MIKMPLKKTTRCLQCSSEFADKEIDGVQCCPKCGTKSLPMAISNDVDCKINWHELRVLCIWAENYAKQVDKANKDNKDWESMLMTVMVIAERLQNQFPDKTKLTLFSEVRELRKKYDITTNIDNDENLGI